MADIKGFTRARVAEHSPGGKSHRQKSHGRGRGKRGPTRATSTPGEVMDMAATDLFVSDLPGRLKISSGRQEGDSLDIGERERLQVKEAVIGELAKDTGLSKSRVNSIVEAWADSSNAGVQSAATQDAASELFGIEMSGWQKGIHSRFVNTAGFAERKAEAKKVLASMYKRTQDRYKKAGIKEVTVYRGTAGRYLAGSTMGRKVGLKTNVLESWSLSAGVADFFSSEGASGAKEPGVTFRAIVPVGRILSTGRTGFGSITQMEMVVMGGSSGAMTNKVYTNEPTHFSEATKKASKKSVKVIDISPNGDWIKALPNYDQEIRIHKKLARKYQKKEPALAEGGGSSGNWGHKGRPGKQGGSLPKGVAYSLHGNVTTATIDRFTEAFEDIPAPIRQLVGTVQLYEEGGPTFKAEGSGKEYETGAYWEEATGTLRIYSANDKSTERFGDVLYHETGHSFNGEWTRRSNAQLEKHTPSMFAKYMDSKGKATVPLKDVPSDKRIAMSFMHFDQAWRSGEDGITPYSKAWAKSEAGRSETIAELSRLYGGYRRAYNTGKSKMKPGEALRLHTSLEAPQLTEAFLSVWGDISGDTLAETLVEHARHRQKSHGRRRGKRKRAEIEKAIMSSSTPGEFESNLADVTWDKEYGAVFDKDGNRLHIQKGGTGHEGLDPVPESMRKKAAGGVFIHNHPIGELDYGNPPSRYDVFNSVTGFAGNWTGEVRVVSGLKTYATKFSKKLSDKEWGTAWSTWENTLGKFKLKAEGKIPKAAMANLEHPWWHELERSGRDSAWRAVSKVGRYGISYSGRDTKRLSEGSFSASEQKMETKLFDGEMRPATPKLATVAVTLGFDKDGLVVSSRVGTVRSNLTEHARHNQKSHGRSKVKLHVFGNVSDEAQDRFTGVYEELPEPITGLIRTMTVNEKKGPAFKIEGSDEVYETGATWQEERGILKIYDLNNKSAYQMRSELSHEAGHAFQGEWWRRAEQQERDSGSKLMSKYVRKSGQPKKELQAIPSEQQLAVSKRLWDRAWSRGEDGITPYSKAWAKSPAGPSETIAEMSFIFQNARHAYKTGASKKKPAAVLREASRDAPFLAEAFLISWQNLGERPVEGLSEAKKGTKSVKTETKLFDAKWHPAKRGEAVYATTLKFDKDGLVVSSRIGVAKSAKLAEFSEAKLDWKARRRQLTKLQKAIFERFRYKDSDTRTIRAAVLEMKLDGFTEEIERLLRRAGCQRRAELTDVSIRDIIVAESEEEADSIVNTFNFELIGAILRIAGSKPEITRKGYADGLREWEGARADYKGTQISQWTISRASNFAATLFFARNRSLLSGRGTAKLRGPRPAKEEICQGWFNRGRVPAEEMLADPPPYHLNCPHWADYRPGRVKSQDCSKLWVGG